MDSMPGTYALILEARTAREVSVGRLGTLALVPGWYVYVGSAFGPGGLRARCAHHLRAAPKPHWHVDYLRAATRLCEIWFTQDPRPHEHQWAEQMARARGAKVPFARFGATDCHCPSHLSFHREYPSLGAFKRRLYSHCPGHLTVRNNVSLAATRH